MKIIRARLKPINGSSEYVSTLGKIKGLISDQKNKGDAFNFVVKDGNRSSSIEFSPDNINADFVGKRIPILDGYFLAQFNEDGTIDVVTGDPTSVKNENISNLKHLKKFDQF